MKRPFSPLVWLCAAGTLALGVLTVYDPGSTYAGYIDALDSNTPILAAVFTAARDGVYPWTPPAEAVVPSGSPAYRPLTETVTDEEMRSSVGNDEPFSESAPAQPDASAAPSTGSVPTAASAPDGEAGESIETGETASAPGFSSGFVTVDESWFNDALFIGDSHIEGLCDYGGLSNATFYFKRGLDIWSVLNKPFVGGKQTIPQALSERRFGKIYIMLGINEIGVGTTESYAAQYADVVARLRELQPNALIYIQAIFHTSQKKSDTTIYNNDTINARNAAISTLADGQHIFFVDCNAVFDDENGALTSTYSGDGVHVKAPYYTMWRDYLLRFGLSGVAAAEAPVEQDAAPSIPVSAPAQPAKPAPVPAPAAVEAPAEEPPAGQPEVGQLENRQPAPGQPESGAAADKPSAGGEAAPNEAAPEGTSPDEAAPSDAVSDGIAPAVPSPVPDAPNAPSDDGSAAGSAEASAPADAEGAPAADPDVSEPEPPPDAGSAE